MTQRDASTTHLMLRTGLWLCAVPVSVVEETMRPLPITPLECGIGPVKGLAICRGEAVPVVCAAELLGEKAAVIGRFVTIRCGARRVALAVASVLGMRTLDPGAEKDWPSLAQGATSAAIKTIGVLDHQLLAVLHASRLVQAEDWEKLDAAPRLGAP
jgi:purine-binding chemotaxis protein CheW